MKLIALLETIPADNSGTGERQVAEKAVEADTYQQAYAELLGQVPADWRIVNVRRHYEDAPTDQYGRTRAP